MVRFHLRRFEAWAISFTPLCPCLSEETLKAVGPNSCVSSRLGCLEYNYLRLERLTHPQWQPAQGTTGDHRIRADAEICMEMHTHKHACMHTPSSMAVCCTHTQACTHAHILIYGCLLHTHKHARTHTPSSIAVCCTHTQACTHAHSLIYGCLLHTHKHARTHTPSSIAVCCTHTHKHARTHTPSSTAVCCTHKHACTHTPSSMAVCCTNTSMHARTHARTHPHLQLFRVTGCYCMLITHSSLPDC